MHVIGTAGHVDHGKSTLVKALTGMDPDRFAEEKARGLTIDLGFAWTSLPSGREIGIVDVPGHERFIRNMLAGVGGIDAALFVVAADEGWMPQSAEHLAILDFLQVRAGLVALTKRDLVDDETGTLVADEITERLAGTVLEGATIVPLSSTKGEGLDDLRKQLDELLETTSEAADRGRPRMFVDRSFSITGAGTVVTGTLTGGRLRAGDEIEVLPSGDRARVRSLQTHRRPVDEAVPGSRVAANLVGLEKQDVERGYAIVRPDDWHLSDTFAARVRVSRDLEHPIVEKGAYELYIGSAEIPCRLKFLEDPPDHGGRIPALIPGADLLVQVFCMRPVPLEPGDRFIVRDVGRWQTVAGGFVLDHFPGRVRRGDPDVLARLRAREAAARDDLVAQIVAERKVLGLADLGWLAGGGPQEVRDALARAVAEQQAVVVGEHVLEPPHEQALRHKARDAVAVHHMDHPLEPGMPREALRAALDVQPKLFGELLAHWRDGLVAEGSVVRLPEHTLALGAEDERAAAEALDKLRAGGASPPDVSELGLAADLVKALERRGDLVRVTPDIAYAANVIRGIEQSVVRLIAAQGQATVAQVRDAIGTTRKYAVPLLEYLDSSGITRRQGDVRVLGPRGRRLAESP
jgi:selenocysteine-specific elongation factor